MNNIDIAVLTVFFLSVLIGFVKGGLSSILSTTGWILAIIGNHYVFTNIEPFLERKFESKILTFSVGYIGGFFLLLFIISIINFIILTATESFRNGYIDKILGIVFGGIRGILIIVTVFMCFEIGFRSLIGDNMHSNAFPEVLLQSKFLPLMKRGQIILSNYTPNELNAYIIPLNNHDDAMLLSLIRKLSDNLTSTELSKINTQNDSKYIPKKQALYRRISILWKYYENQKTHRKELSPEEINQIKSILQLL